MVAEPPKLAQKISDKIMGMGLNSIMRASSMVTAAKKRITVMLSMNIASTKLITMKAKKMGITW